MGAIKAIIETTNGLTLEGVCTFVGGATMSIDVLFITANEANKLYEIDASMRQYNDVWTIQIAKKTIKSVTFND